MDRKIVAEPYGVDSFAIHWYYNQPGAEAEPNARLLERGVTNSSLLAKTIACGSCSNSATIPRTKSRRTRFKAGALNCYFYAQNGQNRIICKKRMGRLLRAVREMGAREMPSACSVSRHEAIPKRHRRAQPRRREHRSRRYPDRLRALRHALHRA